MSKRTGPGKMGRPTVLVTPSGVVVGGVVGEVREVVALAGDREANGEALPGERPVRLPRGLTRARWYETRGGVLDGLLCWTYSKGGGR